MSLVAKFVRLKREIGTSRRHWGDGEFAAVNRGWAPGGHDTRELHGAAAVESIAMDGQSIGSEAAAAVTHNSVSQ